MPNYAYEAVNAAGRKVKGVIHSVSKQAAIRELRHMQLDVRSVQEREERFWDRDIPFGKRVGLKDFTVFCRQFAALLSSGVQIDKALEIMEEQTANKVLKVSLRDLLDQVSGGMPLSAAMRRHPRIFPDLFVNMLMSGEAGGRLDETLERLAGHYEKEHKTVQKVKSAMVYPVIVLLFSVAVVVFLLTSIVPTFVSMFESQGQELPAVTRLIMRASGFLAEWGWLIGIGIAAAVILFRVAAARDRGREMADRLKFRIPLFGAILRKAAIARLTRTLASLYSSGVPLLEALAVAGRVTGNRVLAGVLESARDSLAEGRQLSEPFLKSGEFPKMVTSMLVIGEETGQIDRMFGKIADFYENDVEQSVDRLKSLVEPLLLLLVSGIVGLIISAVMSPMFKMYENMLG